jgi:YVTN family beta-propeller protein
MGTVDYVAPEQIRGEDVDGRADVYALGCLLFETLTGTLPFAGTSDVAVVFAHLEEPPPAASERNPNLSSAVDEALARAIAKDPDERHANCRELIEETRTALGLGAREPRRRLLVALGIAAAIVAAAIVAAALLVRGGDRTTSGPAGALVRIDAATGKTAASIRVGSYPSTIAASRGTVWVGSTRESALWKVTPATGAVERVPASGSPRDISIWRGRAYVASDGAVVFTGTVSQYDARSGIRHGSVDILACSLTAGAAGVWAAGCPNVVQLRSKPDALQVLRTVPIPYRKNATSDSYRICLCDMATGLGSVWVIGDWTDARLWRIDPLHGRITATFELPFRPQALAVGDGSVWIADPVGDRLARLDPRTGRVQALIPVGRGPSSVDIGAGSVWVANHLDGTVSRIDPESGRVSETIDVGPRPVELAVDGPDVWVVLEAA